MFNILNIPHEKNQEENIPIYIFKAEDLYPVVIGRIQDVLKGANPIELLATSERGGNARADVLLNNARELPEQAWKDALKPREEFTSIPYFSVVQRNGKANQGMLAAFNEETRKEVIRMVQRGYALEIALGWFTHALRLAVGKNINRINSVDINRPFRL